MIRFFAALFLVHLSAFAASAQNYVLVSTGESYGLQNYYRLNDDAQTSVPNDAWDLQFFFYGDGIFINESSKTTFLEPSREIRFYRAPGDDFSAVFSSDEVSGKRLWNDETSWQYGALNTLRDPNDPDDLGWGRKNSDGTATGTRVFAVRLRDGQWKKFKILSRDFFEYRLQYANLDGSAEKIVTIPLPDFSPLVFGYFSFEKGEMISSVPFDWDLVFQRYVTPLDDNMGGILDYTVTGVLSNFGVQVAQATQVNPATVAFENYRDSLSAQPDVIGYDWKSFDFTNSNEWTVYDDRAYFVATRQGEIWKIVFIDFEGSATGNIVFQKFKVGDLSSTDDPESPLSSFFVFPNPSAGDFQVALVCKKSDDHALVSIFNTAGQSVFSNPTKLNEGLNVLEFNNLNLPSGLYFVKVETGGAARTMRLLRR